MLAIDLTTSALGRLPTAAGDPDVALSVSLRRRSRRSLRGPAPRARDAGRAPARGRRRRMLERRAARTSSGSSTARSRHGSNVWRRFACLRSFRRARRDRHDRDEAGDAARPRCSRGRLCDRPAGHDAARVGGQHAIRGAVHADARWRRSGRRPRHTRAGHACARERRPRRLPQGWSLLWSNAPHRGRARVAVSRGDDA